MEQWKRIIDYPNYEVSNLGRIRNRTTNKYLSPGLSGGKYLTVSLGRDGKFFTHKVHRLVALYFVENIHNYPQVNHKDENKLKNNANNLEWCTNEYNHNYGTRNQRNANKLNKKILQLDKDNNIITTYNSINEAASLMRCNQSSISLCLIGKNKTCKGFKWSYAEGPEYKKKIK